MPFSTEIDRFVDDDSIAVNDRTFSVKEINEAISLAVSTSFPDEVWVKGDVQKLRFHTSGHIYFDLVDSGTKASSPSVIPCTLLKWQAQKIKANLREILAEDREVRIKVRPDFYAPFGKMSLHVSDVDTQFSLGQIAIARRELLMKLHNEGILKANTQLELSGFPLKLILITSVGSAAHADVLDQLKQSEIGFNVKVINALMQGSEAPDSVARAFELANKIDGDIILLCRGGGSKADLATFDTEKVARSIIAANKPVLTGLGHQIDISVADETAFIHLKTPTACAQYIIEMIQTSISNMLSLKESIDTTSLDRIFTSETRLANISQKLGEVNYLLDKSSEGLKSIALLIKDKVSNIFDRDTQNLLALKKLIHAHDPMRVVERGYSLTLNDKGKVISSIDDIENNENITTRLSDGEIISTVKEKKENK
ncbi:MAG: exodeoxyribonuclease VII large subunit [Acidimicrobiia bacterium]|nr:exodeoxyribonuclease VII large subunit [Acidimicrobiia bacterium]